MNQFATRIIVLVLLLVVGCLAQVPSSKPALDSKPQVPAPPANPMQGVHQLEAADVEAFFDGISSIQLDRSDIAGVTALVMKDGQTLLEKGYGYAHWKKKVPVDAAGTAFRLASISKLA